MKKLFLLLPLAALTACGSDNSKSEASDKDLLMSSNIDDMVGWQADVNALTKGEAHSGEYCLRVDQNREFSPGYNAIIGKLASNRPRAIKLEAWTYATDKNATGKLEFVIKDSGNGQEFLHDQTRIDQVGSFGKWEKLSKTITLPATANYNSQIFIYVSRAGGTSPAFVDDISLTAIK
jgi:hypothetical protein